MRSPAEIKSLVEARLKTYLSRDTTGIRREMLTLFLRTRSFTIAEIFSLLKGHFSISYHSIAAMVGIIASRIGILHVNRNKDSSCTVYELKAQYFDIVRRIVRTC